MSRFKKFFGTPLSYRVTFWDLLTAALLILGVVKLVEVV